jgi:hypothetical protein
MDADPDPAYRVDANLYPDFYLMRSGSTKLVEIRYRCGSLVMKDDIKKVVIRSYRLGDRAEQQEKYRDDGSHSFRGNRKEKKAGQRGRAKKKKCRVDARDWLEENRRREQENILIHGQGNTWSSSAFAGVGNTGRRGGENRRTNNRGEKRQEKTPRQAANNVRWKNSKRMRVEEIEEDGEATDRIPDVQQSCSSDSSRWRGVGSRPADRSPGRWKEARAGRGRSPEKRMDRERSPARCERRECCYSSQEIWEKKTGYGGSRDQLGEERDRRRRRSPEGRIEEVGSPDYLVEKRMRRRSPEGWAEDRGSPDEWAEDRMRRRSPEGWAKDRGSPGEWVPVEDRMRRRSPKEWAEDGGSPDDWAGCMRGGGDRVQYDYRYPADDFDS